jgi:hypothetical protein
MLSWIKFHKILAYRRSFNSIKKYETFSLPRSKGLAEVVSSFLCSSVFVKTPVKKFFPTSRVDQKMLQLEYY